MNARTLATRRPRVSVASRPSREALAGVPASHVLLPPFGCWLCPPAVPALAAAAPLARDDLSRRIR
jgi:hypothetical protein